jgi:hypothetical protein
VADARRRAAPVNLTNTEPGGAVESRPWGFLKLLSGGRSVLVVYTVGDGCSQPLGFRVQQGRNAVELTSLVTHAGGACSQPAIIGYGIVRLDQPLRSRSLLHAPVN